MSDDALKEAKKRYKNTVHLPKTDFPMKAGLQQKEPERQKKWAEEDLYGQIREARKDAEPWVLHDGPPYANGDAHTGTGMNKILKDMVVKFRTMQGFDVPYVPGWDCHGLPIEHNVLKELGGKKPDDMSSVKLRELCLDYANKFVDKQREQFKSAGVLGRWDDPYLTTSPRYEANVLRVFRDLRTRGYITRAKRPVHWSWAAQSALAEAELEYEDREDPSVFVRFPLFMNTSNCKFAKSVDLKSVPGLSWEDCALLVWTTTPWTLPSNVAVAMARDAEYCLVAYTRNDDSSNSKPEAFVVAEELREQVLSKLDVSNVQVLGRWRGEDFDGLYCYQPIFGPHQPQKGEFGKVVFANYVTLDDGTGLVHTAPGHGKEDFETGKKEALAIICPIDESGRFYTGERLFHEFMLQDLGESEQDASEVAEFHGLTHTNRVVDWLKLLEGKNVFDANSVIAEKLQREGLLLYTEPYPHSYPHCWRTHTPVIFRVTEQWFVNVDHVEEGETKPLRQRILDEIKSVQWFPAWGEKRISAMVENRPDWCISRQRNWGIPIPAFYDVETGETCMDTETVDRVIALVEEHGSNVWYDDENWPVEKLLPDEFRPDKFKGRELKKMDDIFDVWFESGASHRAVMLADPELKDKFPAGLYLEGDDQHRGWFQVSLILSVATQGRSPFKQCLTSAFVVDENGEKGSKSKGNIWPIDKGVKDLSADLIRLYFAAANTSEPIPVTYDLIRGAADSYRKLRNTWRTLVANLFDFDPRKDQAPAGQLRELDRWALSRAATLIETVTGYWERYEFHHATRALVHFCTVDLSAQYIDVCKDALYCEGADAIERRRVQTVYWHLAQVLVKLMAPVVVHTADEMWEHLPTLDDQPGSVHLADWPKADGVVKHDTRLEERYRLLFKIKAESDRILDRLRKEKRIGKGYDTVVTLGLSEVLAGELAEHGEPESLEPELAEVLNVSRVHLDNDSDHGALQEFEPATDVKGLWVRVDRLEDEPCVRCFRRTGDVGTVQKHEHLCKRCADVVGADA